MAFWSIFLAAFVPLFVSVDAIGTLPIFIGMTSNISPTHREKLVRNAVFTAFAVSLLFLLLGRLIFSFLGITADDFRIAGGLVLLIIAVSDLVTSTEKDPGRDPGPHLGVVPIGIPLTIGPAALTTLLILVEQQGYGPTLLALCVNLAITFLVFSNATRIERLIGVSSSKAFAKVASLFLAAIGVMMIRVGLENIVRGH